METLLQVSSTISKVITMSNRALRIHIDTQENLTDEVITKIISQYDKQGYFFFAADRIQPQQIADIIPELPKVEVKEKKSPSQKLRETMYIYWEQKGINDDFKVWYEKELERIRNAYKNKLN